MSGQRIIVVVTLILSRIRVGVPMIGRRLEVTLPEVDQGVDKEQIADGNQDDFGDQRSLAVRPLRHVRPQNHRRQASQEENHGVDVDFRPVLLAEDSPD